MIVKVEGINYGPCRTSLLVMLCLRKEGDIFFHTCRDPANISSGGGEESVHPVDVWRIQQKEKKLCNCVLVCVCLSVCLSVCVSVLEASLSKSDHRTPENNSRQCFWDVVRAHMKGKKSTACLNLKDVL